METKHTEIEFTRPFWVLQREDEKLVLTECDTLRDLDAIIEDIVVSAGEQGQSDNIIAKSHSNEELQFVAEQREYPRSEVSK